MALFPAESHHSVCSDCLNSDNIEESLDFGLESELIVKVGKLVC